MNMDKVNSSDKWLEFGKEFGIKTHNFTNPLLVQHKTHLQAKSTLNHMDNKQAGHTNENKQLWYKVITITKIWKYSIFTKKPKNLCI